MNIEELTKERQTERSLLRNVSQLLVKEIDSILFRTGTIYDINKVVSIYEIESLCQEISMARTIMNIKGGIVFHEEFFSEKTPDRTAVYKVYNQFIPIFPIAMQESQTLENGKYNYIVFDKTSSLIIGKDNIKIQEKLISYYKESSINETIANMRGKDFI